MYVDKLKIAVFYFEEFLLNSVTNAKDLNKLMWKMGEGVNRYF